MVCSKCGKLKGLNVRATIVIFDRQNCCRAVGSEVDLRDLCAAVDAWVQTMLVGCEVRFSLPEDLVGHF